MTISAKFSGICRACGGAVRVGQQVEWVRGERGVTHTTCAGGQPVARAQTPAPRTYSQRAEASRRAWGRSRGMGPGHGQATSVPGYSSYCTDSPSCRCYDCAS